MKIAVLNAGSSSLKYKLFEMPSGEELASKTVENIGEKNSPIKNHKEALESLSIDFETIDALGHRVVHGGEVFSKSVLIDDAVMQTIEQLIPLAPLHNGANLEGIKVAKAKLPNTPQIAVFDTAFHATISQEAYLYALPIAMYKKHNIRRYGFHGTSHSYVSKMAAKLLHKDISTLNIITLHLGNGASACAIQNGKSIDTSMGFTPLEGLVMGSRSGDIDPAIILYMHTELGFSLEKIDTILNKESGLLGICQENDVRKIIASDSETSHLAISIMVRRIQKYIGAYMALLEDIDAIVFTGGIGENSSYIRERIMRSKLFSNVKQLVIQTDEELEIANECMRILKRK